LPLGSASEKQLHNILLERIQASCTEWNVYNKMKMFQAWYFFSIFTAVQSSSSLIVAHVAFKGTI
jgi:hypothetical protein